MSSDNRRIDQQPRHRKVDVVAGCRIHFGLLSTKNTTGESFGGCGLMLRRPCVWIQVTEATEFSASERFQERCRSIAERFSEHFGLPELPRCQIEVCRVPEPHTGLGSGTQISLAVASGLLSMFDASMPIEQLATDIAGRGRRSAVGVHGFSLGGMICEAGVLKAGDLGQLISSDPFPKDWRILLARPLQSSSVVFGSGEQKRFDSLTAKEVDDSISLKDIMLKEVLPSVQRAEFERFSRAIADYNLRSGNLFADVQGDAYNGPTLRALVDHMQSVGCKGVGQSSWGPTIFAFAPNQSQAEQMRERILHASPIGPLSVEIVSARNKPASICSGVCKDTAAGVE